MGKIRSILRKLYPQAAYSRVNLLESLQEYLGFVLALNEAVKGKNNSLAGVELSEVVVKLIKLLGRLDEMINETPPIKQPQRFGNKAFRAWLDKVQGVS